MREFTPETLDDNATSIENLRVDILFNTDVHGADVMAKQEMLLSLAALDTAQRHMRIAQYHQSRALADQQRS